MLIAALFIVVKIWKQAQCPSIDECIQCVIYLLNGILCRKKEENFNLWNRMDGSGKVK